ncbi:14016_t:CDS:2 [Entrophospora sp. SA101]|nr:14016_t:CDS:2 [Entrophospora sp. SA101]
MDFVKSVIQPYSNSSNTKEEDYLISQINDYIKLYERIEERGIELNNQINTYHEKIQQSAIAPKIKEALKSLYADMIDQTEKLKHEFTKYNPALALYSETTCFYEAIDVPPLSKITSSKKDCCLRMMDVPRDT